MRSGRNFGGLLIVFAGFAAGLMLAKHSQLSSNDGYLELSSSASEGESRGSLLKEDTDEKFVCNEAMAFELVRSAQFVNCFFTGNLSCAARLTAGFFTDSVGVKGFVGVGMGLTATEVMGAKIDSTLRENRSFVIDRINETHRSQYREVLSKEYESQLRSFTQAGDSPSQAVAKAKKVSALKVVEEVIDDMNRPGLDIWVDSNSRLEAAARLARIKSLSKAAHVNKVLNKVIVNSTKVAGGVAAPVVFFVDSTMGATAAGDCAGDRLSYTWENVTYAPIDDVNGTMSNRSCSVYMDQRAPEVQTFLRLPVEKKIEIWQNQPPLCTYYSVLLKMIQSNDRRIRRQIAEMEGLELPSCSLPKGSGGSFTAIRQGQKYRYEVSFNVGGVQRSTPILSIYHLGPAAGPALPSELLMRRYYTRNMGGNLMIDTISNRNMSRMVNRTFSEYLESVHNDPKQLGVLTDFWFLSFWGQALQRCCNEDQGEQCFSSFLGVMFNEQ